MIQLVSIFFFLFSFGLCCAQQELVHESKEITVLLGDHEQSFDEINDFLPEPCSVARISIDSDGALQKSEFDYFFPFLSGDVVSADAIKTACRAFAKKNKFNSVRIAIIPEENGCALQFNFNSLWTFHRVRFHGMQIGKDSYRQYYLLEPGESFSVKKHQDSLTKIKEAYEAEGYFRADIADYFDYDHKARCVTANIVLNPGAQFLIDDVSVVCTGDAPVSDYDCSELTKLLKRKFVPLLRKKYYTQALVNRNTTYLKDLIARKGFLSTAITLHKKFNMKGGLVALEYAVHLKDRKRFLFYGNQFFSKRALLELILQFGRSAYELPLSILSEELIQAYKKKGFLHVQIETKQQGESYIFLIREGSRLKVNQVLIRGAEFLTVDQIRKKFFSTVLNQSYFETDSFKKALSNLVLYYVKQGFWDFKILNYDFSPSLRPGVYRAVLTVDEGPRRFLKRVDIPQFPYLINQGPFRSLKKTLPAPFDLYTIQEQRQWLSDYFHSKGYLYTQIEHKLFYEGGDVYVEWDINLNGEPVRFGKTILTGSTKFPLQSFVNKLPYKEGDVWDKRKLDQSFKLLRDFGVFETIHFYPDAITEQEPTKDVIVKLVEDDPFEIRVRAGFQQVSKYLTFRSGTTYKFGGSFLYKNPCNVGDVFGFNADITRFYRNIAVVYQRPFMFGLPVFTVLKGYANKYTQPVLIGTNKPLYRATQDGFLVGINRRFEVIDFGISTGVELMETSGLSQERARAIHFEPTLIDKKVPYLFAEPIIFIDFLDDKLNPTRGSLTAISCKGMISSKSEAVTFFKVLLEQSFFMSIHPLVLAFRIRFGHMFSGKFSTVMPIERFYLGGANSLRGYEPDLAPPLGLLTRKNGKQRLVPQGGKSMFNANLELRFPLFKGFSGVVFHDMGVLASNAMSRVMAGEILSASGFGLRYNTPIGPLRFDIGWKWNKQDPLESSYAWFLTLGHAF